MHCPKLGGRGAQFVAVLTASLGGISDGMHFGWTSPAVPKMQEPDSPVKIDRDDAYLMQIIFMAGGVAGIPLTVYFVDKLGRNACILLTALQNVVCWVCFAVAKHRIFLLVLRFWAGLNCDINGIIVPIYICECVDPKLRGQLQTFFSSTIVIGTVLVYSIVPYMPIWASSTVGAVIVLVQVIVTIYLPQSPYWLLVKKRREQAWKSLQWLRRKDDSLIEIELEEIEAGIRRQEQEGRRPQDICVIRSNRKALFITVTINSAQHFCGLSVIVMNIETILRSGGAVENLNEQIGSIMFGMSLLLGCVISLFVIDRYGRRPLLMSSCAFTGFVLAGFGTYFLLKDVYAMDMHKWILTPTILSMMYAVVFKYGLGLAGTVIPAELFSTNVKACGMTIADVFYAVMSVISVKIYFVAIEHCGMYLPFYIFAGVSFGMVWYIFLFLPETKGLTLEEIQMVLKEIRFQPSRTRSLAVLSNVTQRPK